MKENKRPPVSILIICFNHERFIEEAIRSVFRQTYKNIELVVVDNNSTDNSREVIERLQDEYRFRFIEQENIGVPRTLNKFVPLLKGKYIAFFSGDDFMPPYRIKTQVDFMEANPQYAMCYGRTIFVDENGNELYRNRNKLFRSGYIFEDLITFKFYLPAPTFFFRKEVFEKVGLYDEKLKFIEDQYMSFKIAQHFQIGFIDKYLAFQRKHSHNLTDTVDFSEQIKEEFLIFQNYKSLKNYNRLLTRLYLHFFCFFSTRDIKLAIKYMILSIPYFYRKEYIKSILRTIYYISKRLVNFKYKLF